MLNLLPILLIKSTVIGDDPYKIMKQMGQTYARCKTYQDHGRVLSVPHQGRGVVRVSRDAKLKLELTFKTYYVGPNRLRFQFEYSDFDGKPQKFVTWTDGRTVRTWWTIESGIEKNSDIGEAIAGATGISLAAGYNLPALLMKEEIGGNNLLETHDLRLGAEEQVDGHQCHVVWGTSRLGGETVMWIDKQSFLLRKLREDEDTTIYSPILDKPISRDIFQFKPPR